MRHGGVQGEKAVERERWPVVAFGKGDVAAQARIGRIADGRHSAEAIEGAAQHDGDEAWIAGRGQGMAGRRKRPEGGRGAQERAAGDDHRGFLIDAEIRGT